MNSIPKRFRFAGIFFTAIGVMILFQVLRIQFGSNATALRDFTNRYAWAVKTIKPERGEIYDRNGNLLAGNQSVYEISIEAIYLPKDPADLAWLMQSVIQVDYFKRVNAAKAVAGDRLRNVTLADYVPPEKARQLFQLAKLWEERKTSKEKSKSDKKPDLTDIAVQEDKPFQDEDMESDRPMDLIFSRHMARVYPEKSLASNVIGFVSLEDGMGHFGVEEKFEQLLAGNQREVRIPLDPNLAGKTPVTPEGVSLILTIDREIQASIEKIVDNAVENTKAKSGTIVVLDPKTGEILAVSSTPRLDLNTYSDYPKIFESALHFNRAVSEPLEPGSTFKVFTMAAALDSRTVKPETTFLDTGEINVGGLPIYNWNGGAWGNQTMTGCLQHSLNVCMSWIAMKMEAGRFYDYMRKFGFGHYTGVDIALEAPGRLKLPGDNDWSEADLGANSFGQAVSTTPLQLVMAASAIANDGKMAMPHIVKAMVERGRQHDVQPQVAGAPITAKTARTLTDMLTISLKGESSTALVDGYSVAGKTGTAQIPVEGGYDDTETNASFIGWGPSDDPRFLVYIWLERPKTSIWGSEVAAPVFSEVVQQLVILMDLPPDQVRLQMVGKFNGLAKKQ